MPAVDAFSHAHARAFLTAFATVGIVSRAAALAGVDRRSHYVWLEHLAGYRDLFAAAQEIAIDFLEQEARRRAVDGLVRYRFHPKTGRPLRHPLTKQPYYELEYSDKLLEVLLRGRRPDVFKDRRELTGKDGGPLQVQQPADLSKLSDDELEQLRQLVGKAHAGPTVESRT